MQNQNSVVKGIKWTSMGTIGVAVCSLLRLSILTRFLDREDFGLMALVLFVLGVISLFMDMGLTSAIFHRQEISKKEYSSLYWINLAFGILVFIVIVFLSPLIANFYDSPLLSSLIIIMSTTVIFAGLGNQFRTVEQKKLNFKIIALVELLSAILSLIVAIVMAVKGFGIYALVISALIQYALPNIFFFLRGWLLYPLLFHFNLKESFLFLRIGIFEVGSQFVNYFNRDMDIIIIGKVFSPEILGGYSLAKQLVYKPAQIVNPIITKISNPLLAKFQGNLSSLKKNYLKLINIVSSVNFFVYLLVFLFAPLIVQILYGTEYENIVILVRILSVYMYIRSIGNPIGSLVIATGRTDISFFWNIFSLLVMPAFIFIGTQFSAEAVAYAMVAGIIALFVPNWWLLVKRMTGASLLEFCSAVVPKLYLKEMRIFIQKRNKNI
ncbi:MOP flippase family protein [Leeuwenhoekiella sp.]|uniref:MOP flippase family protein n=1 Tax=Leeuwenhoekiella sp. TaxID=1977054 RepID=UPI000C5A679B|nr:MOP flippase family protein [Leeuwenhoekiella sp.]MBA80271.1 colanic acid exporter [Leeuwenhoekiella sp.]|tara:strand:+ start:125738 stop:127051 length:1314 start_codon:yes stop_codon:yes gene_type:complete